MPHTQPDGLHPHVPIRDLRARLSGTALAANALWSLAAQVVPAVVGVATIPFMVRGLGVDRVGVLTLAWMVIGYFSLFDLGLGRAVTKVAAEVLPLPDRSSLSALVWTAWYMLAAIGLLGTLLMAGLTPWLVNVIKPPTNLRHETLVSFYLLAASVPIVVSTTGIRGVLEADQRFDLVAIVRMFTGLFTFLVPVAVLQFSASLPIIILAVIGVRLAGVVAYGVMCHRSVPDLAGPVRIDRSTARRLLSFGSWMTVSNVVSPLMVSLDRFFVGALISVAAVAYYATPFEAVTKLQVIAGAISGVVFPAISAASVTDQPRMSRLLAVAVGSTFAALFPFAIAVIGFAPQALRLWLGDAFAQQSSTVLRLLMLGVLANSVAAMPFALLQGIGRSDLTGKLHLAEAPFYFVLLIWLVRAEGINGAALAWCARVTVDMLMLFWLAGRSLGLQRDWWLSVALLPAVFVPALALGWLDVPILLKLGLSVALIVIFITCWWRRDAPTIARAAVLQLLPRSRG